MEALVSLYAPCLCEQTDAKAIFDQLDTTRVGALGYDQLPQLFRRMDPRLNRDDLRALVTLVHLYDAQSEGTVGACCFWLPWKQGCTDRGSGCSPRLQSRPCPCLPLHKVGDLTVHDGLHSALFCMRR